MQPQDPLDVPFCDLCNSSVPLQDLERGTAVRHLGKTIGACCLDAMRPPAATAAGAAVQPAAPATPARSAGQHETRLLPLGIAVLAAVAAATIFADYRLAAVDERWSTVTGRIEDDLQSVAEVLQTVSLTLDGVARRSDFDGLGVRLAAIEGTGARRSEQLQALSEQTSQAAAALLEQVRVLERRIPDHGPALAELRQQLQQQAVALAELRALPRAAEPIPVAEPPAVPTAPGVPASLQHQIARLQDEDPATRFEAVDELLRSRDVAMLEHLLPMAKDGDTFVRRLTVEGLRDFRTPEVVDALLVSLADPEEIVRDTAWRSLKDLTGQKLPFEATAARDVRARAQQKWQEWWDKNRATFGG